jgi:hypothetical protein
MSKIRLLMISVLGVLVLGAVASTVASAQPTATCTPSGTKTLTMACIETLSATLLVLGLPAAESIEVLSKKEAGTGSKLVTPSLSSTEITCTEAANTGTLDGNPTTSAELLKLVVVFTGCTVPSPAGCSIMGGTITTKSLDAVPSNEEGDLIFLPETAPVFAEFTVAGESCAIALAGAKVEGTVLGLVLEPETDKEIHLIDFEASGGENLLFEKKASELTLTEEVFLDKPSLWSSSIFDEHPAWGLFLTEAIS